VYVAINEALKKPCDSPSLLLFVTLWHQKKAKTKKECGLVLLNLPRFKISKQRSVNSSTRFVFDEDCDIDMGFTWQLTHALVKSVQDPDAFLFV